MCADVKHDRSRVLWITIEGRGRWNPASRPRNRVCCDLSKEEQGWIIYLTQPKAIADAWTINATTTLERMMRSGRIGGVRRVIFHASKEVRGEFVLRVIP